MTRLVLSEIYPPKIGGSGQWLHELYSRIANDQLVLLVGEHKDAAEFDKNSQMSIVRANLSGDAWTMMTKSGRDYLRGMYKQVASLHRQYSATEIHCARVIPEGLVGWFASVFLRIQLVCFVHGEDIELAYESKETRWLVKRVLAQSTRLICNSQNTKRMLIDSWNCNEKKIIVLYPGIDTKYFKPADDTQIQKNALGWADRPVLLTVSRLEIRKGHDIMLEALPAIIERIPNLLYAIVGSGVERTSLEARVASLGLVDNVEFRGACDNDTMLKCIQACDVFILPNRRVGSSVEGFGIVLLEAQACGKPVIAGQSGGTAETMTLEDTGLIVDCTKPENLISPVYELLSNHSRRNAMGYAARSLMLEKFDWSVIAAQAELAAYGGAAVLSKN